MSYSYPATTPRQHKPLSAPSQPSSDLNPGAPSLPPRLGTASAAVRRPWSTTPRRAAGSPGWASGASTTGGGAGSARPAAATSSTAAIATTSPRKTGTSWIGTTSNRLSASSVTPSSRSRRCAATAASAWGSTSAQPATSWTMTLTRSSSIATIAASAGSCYSTTLRDRHCCIENSMKNNCPICYEYLFDSLRETSVLRCGHTMHLQCFHEMLKHDKFSCPICATPIFDMDKFFKALDAEMEASYLYTGKGWVVCNDCRDTTQVFSGMAGHKCCHCQSHNTCRVAPPVLP
ncbi:putative RING zinc finger domain superfamily protein isoform X10 [Zea mays]|uniref:putative RING zinc finger domain superfamily protein isoform X10 n=1 Tax=Zea mays TaxID=4577 RepID=UPI0004DEA789|nr:putative RING zinc finger domain superfamily protein isoform X10 [Zea mays]